MSNITTYTGRAVRASSLTLLLALLALKPSDATKAQRAKDAPLNITEIQSSPTGRGTVVSVMADGPLTRTQTWNDGEGFHLTFPYAGRSPLKRVPRGVKVRRLDRSLEIVVPLTAGSNVTVQPLFNRLNLVVNGEIDSSQRGTDEQLSVESSHVAERAETVVRSEVVPIRETRSRVMADEPPPVLPRSASTSAPSSAPLSASTAAPLAPPPPASSTTQTSVPVNKTAGPTVLVPLQEDAPANGATTVKPDASPSPDPAAEEPGMLARIFSGTSVAILLALGIITLFVVRLRRPKDLEAAPKAVESSQQHQEEQTTALAVTNAQTLNTTTISVSTEERRREQRRKGERKWWGRRSSDLPARLSKADAAAASHTAEQHEAKADARALVHAPTAMFGAYRVDQEVGKLLLGQPHRMDVLASRAPDDRRAVENSLTKALHAPDTDMEARRRALEALEDYGFVARLSASLLLASEAYERAAAARTLGELEALSSLPFLLEALYDVEPIVRTQAVTSLGALKQPAAIGALLDMARRHPEMPASLLSRVLSACSLDCLDFGDAPAIETEMVSVNNAPGPFTGEITRLETSTLLEELPEWLEDEHLTEALSKIESTDAEARKVAARQLAQFQVQRAVYALSQMAANDIEPSVRASAIASLADINHESVFPSVLMAFADEAREVRAAAARALSHLSFDRADAYVRLIEMSGPDKLREVAQACIKGGMAAQAIERLASTDRRQAYESFALLSLLAKCNETEPILDAITKHTDYNVRLSAVRLLGLSGQPEVVQQIRHLAVKDGLPEKLRTALLEVVYKIDQALPV
jgi:HEAT repeat protein